MHIIKTEKKDLPNARKFIKAVFSEGIPESCATLSYYFLFSVFPFLMLLGTTAVFFGITPENIGSFLSAIMPEKLISLMISYVADLSGRGTPAVFFTSLFLTVYSLGRSVQTLKRRIRKIAGRNSGNSAVIEWMISFIFAVLILAAFYATVIIVVTGKKIASAASEIIKISEFDLAFIRIGRLFAVSVFVFFVICGMYLLLPGKLSRRRDIVPGAGIATLGWVISSYIFAYYVDNLNDYSLIYGSLAVIIILMIWLYILNFMILFGAVVNSAIQNERSKTV